MKACSFCGITEGEKRIVSNKTFGDLCCRHYYQAKNFGRPKKTKFDPNEIVMCGDHALIILSDESGNLKGETQIDLSDIERASKHKWHLAARGYAESRIDGKLVKLHQFISGRKGADHLDRNRLNNRRGNLVPKTQTENVWNSSVGKNNKTGVTGVYESAPGKYAAQIMTRGKRMTLGTFDFLAAAVEARESAEIEQRGQLCP